MVVLYLKNQIQLKDDADHILTRFELSDKMNFSNIIASSESEKNKHAVLFNIELDPNVKYYARCRVLLSTGWTKYANLDIVDVRLSGMTGYIQNTLPSKVSTPIITTNSKQDGHTITYFTIKAEGYNVIGNAKHNKTIFFISDLDNNIVWFNVAEVLLNEIIVNDCVLEEDKIYKVNAIFGSSSGDHSQVGSLSILTGGNKTLVLLQDKIWRKGTDLRLDFMRQPGVEYIDCEVYNDYNTTRQSLEYTNRYYENVSMVNSPTLFITIPKDILKNLAVSTEPGVGDISLVILKVKTNLDESFKHIYVPLEP